MYKRKKGQYKSYMMENNDVSRFNPILCLACNMQPGDKKRIEKQIGFIKWLNDEFAN